MGSTSNAKKRGLYHYLYKQWKETKIGHEIHDREVKRQRALPVKPREPK